MEHLEVRLDELPELRLCVQALICQIGEISVQLDHLAAKSVNRVERLLLMVLSNLRMHLRLTSDVSAAEAESLELDVDLLKLVEQVSSDLH